MKFKSTNLFYDDFVQSVENDVVIETVNLSRATLKESIIFKRIIEEDIHKKFKKVVIDASRCEFLDSSFIGTLIFAKNEIKKAGNQLKIVTPDAETSYMKIPRVKTMFLEMFGPTVSLEQALKSFE